MSHYVCTGGCNGVSEDPNAMCLAEGCAKHAMPLTPCECTDQQHEDAYAKDGDSPS